MKNLPNCEKEEEIVLSQLDNKEMIMMNEMNTDRDISPISRCSKDENNVVRQTIPRNPARIGTGDKNARGRVIRNKNSLADHLDF